MSNPHAQDGVVLPSQITIREAAKLRTQLLAALSQPSERVDGTQVSRIDTAGIQVILAYVQDRARAGRSVSWCAVSDALRDAAARLGLTQSLGLGS
ncbi:MAG: STAS domain-containing protein [Steroidobacteraceae bacterium]